MGAAEFKSTPDVRIIDRGSVLLFQPLTTEAHASIETHVSDDRQMLGSGLAVEPRYAAALAEGMARAGLMIGDDADPPAGDELPAAECDVTSDVPVIAVITMARASPDSDRYDLGWLFTCWAWHAGYQQWGDAVRAVARALRGLESASASSSAARCVGPARRRITGSC